MSRFNGKMSEGTLTKSELSIQNKGVMRRIRQIRRQEAITRQQKNIDRGYYVDVHGVKHTPTSVDWF